MKTEGLSNIRGEIVEKQDWDSQKTQKFNIIQVNYLEEHMPHKRYIKQDQDSFFGYYLYDQIVPEKHLYRKL